MLFLTNLVTGEKDHKPGKRKTSSVPHHPFSAFSRQWTVRAPITWRQNCSRKASFGRFALALGEICFVSSSKKRKMKKGWDGLRRNRGRHAKRPIGPHGEWL
jgi:hypothetical protein